MENYRQKYDSSRDSVEREKLPRHRNYYHDDEDSEKNNMNVDDSHLRGVSTSRSKIKGTSERTTSFGSSGGRSRRKEKSSDHHTRQSPDSPVHESATKCIENNFDAATISSAKSIAFSFANPCGLSALNVVHSDRGQPPPVTPSTVGSSFSDESHTTSPDDSLETSSPSLPYGSSKPAAIHARRSSSSNERNGIVFPGRLEKRTADRSIDDEIESRRSLAAGLMNCNKGNDDMIVFVGDEHFRFSSSVSTMGFASKYFFSQSRQADNFSYVDLSTHPPQEFKIVIDFLERNSTTDAWTHIHWKNLPIILPWFVEFQALPMMSAVDTFLLQNALSPPEDRGYPGDNSSQTKSHIGLSNVLQLARIAFACGLESTKLHTRRLLRQALLEPRKQPSSSPDVDGSRLSEAAEDIELEWTLEDLRTLAQILLSHDELREYLWEVAVIIYLPHDLDISDSIGLVSNILFPYLLREGMMQMMIVEGIESSYQTTNSFTTDSSGASSAFTSNRKAGVGSIGSSFSEHTSCSDTTIPTTPSQRNRLSEEEMLQYFRRIMIHLEKFQAEKESREKMLVEKHNSLVEEESPPETMREPVEDVPDTRQRRLYEGTENRAQSKTSRGRGVTTFAC